MSSRKFVYLLMMVAVVCGFMASDAAHGQSTGSLTFKGTVMDTAGTPLPGYNITGETIPVRSAFNFVSNPSRTDGSYDLVVFSFAGAQLNIGDQVKLTATDANGQDHSIIHTITDADVASTVVDLDIIITRVSLDVVVAPGQVPADGTSTATITITVREGTTGVAGDAVAISADKGTVSAVTETGNGVYTATYTAPALTLVIPDVAQILASSAATGLSDRASIALVPVPTTVTVAVAPHIFSADTPGTGVVTVSVDRAGPVADETVTLALAPAVGSVGAVTNNGDGTYSATYTSGSAAGNVTLTATATGANASGTANIVINAGPPAAIALSAAPMTVSSLGSATVTALVTDSNGNGVGGLALTGTTSGSGAIGAFAATTFGSYAATYAAPMVDAEGTETVTVSTAGLSGDLTLSLTPEPPIDVNVITIEGTVYKEDGEIPADGVTVTVTVGSNAPETRTTDENGSYAVTLVNPLGSVATTGDGVSVVVTDATGTERGREQFPLVNAILEEVLGGMPVMVPVTTDIVIPPRTANVLEVMGATYKEDGATSAGSGLTVTVTVGSRSTTVQTDAAGTYSATFVDPLSIVATTGDMLSIVVSDPSGERGRNDTPLSNMDLGLTGSASVTRDVTTDIGLTSSVLAVIGTVYLKNGDTEHVPARSNLREGDLTVTVTNTTRKLSQDMNVGDDGGYGITFVDLLDPLATVAETGDVLTIDVTNDAGQNVGTVTHTLTIADIQSTRIDVDIMSSQPAEVRILAIEGDVINMDGTTAEAGLGVTIRIDMHGTVVEAMTTTDASGRYTHNFVDLVQPVAATGDILTVDVLREADHFHGHAVIELRSYQLAYLNQPLAIDTITLVPPRLDLGGLSINPHYTGVQESSIQQLLGMNLGGIVDAGAGALDSTGDLLGALSSGLAVLIAPALGVVSAFQLELPDGFDPNDENIVKENFGNAITTRPTAWAAFSAVERDTGRWINGNQLHLYISGAPTLENVTFTLGGSSMAGTSVPEGGSFNYTFQLEEEWIALFSGEMPVFGAVQLLIDGHAPVDMTRGDDGVWSADVALTPGAEVAYYYMIDLATPYHDALTGVTVTRFPFIDPLNRQVKTGNLLEGINNLLFSELSGDPQVRSVFHIPAVNYHQSLWVAKFDLNANGVYQLEVDVNYRGGYHESITGKTLYVDRVAPTAEVALHPDAPGPNAGLYMRQDGTYVATGPMPGESSLALSAVPDAISADAGYMYQLARLDESGYPGAWNPVVTPSLLPLNLETLLTHPASVLPLTIGAPHHIEMVIRNSKGTALLGRYGLRAVGIDGLLNMDSGAATSVVVDFVPPDPDIVAISAVQADFDGNGLIEGLESQSAAGDIAIFSNSMVTLVADVVERTVHPLTSVAFHAEIPDANWQWVEVLAADQLTTTMMGDQFTAALLIPDFGSLSAGTQVVLRTVTTNALSVVHEQVISTDYVRRVPPEVAAIHTYVTDRHPDSGAVQGTVTVSAFTQAMTAPDTAAVQLEIRRSADTDWLPLGVVQIADTMVTSHIQLAIIEDLVNSIVGGASVAPISLLYREWPLTVDTATLEDTILDDSPAASDASLDDNPYVVRAIAVDTAGGGYPSADGVADGFSVDNYSPTAITHVANEVEMVEPRADGSYYVSGLLHESVPDPMLTLTARTGAHPNGFVGGIALAVNDASGAAMEIPATAFAAAGAHNHMATFNLASVPNGNYTFRAVAHAADGSPEDRIVAMEIAVEVGNFTPPDNFADPTVDILRVIDTESDARSPSEINAMYPIGFPAIAEEVKATLIVPNVAAGDVDVLIGDDGMSAAAMGALIVMAPDADNNIVICLDTSGLGEGMYGLVGVVTKPNGSVHFGLPSIRVDRTGPEIAIVSPLSRHQVTTLPTIQVTYTDASGFDPNDMAMEPMPVVIGLTRLADDVEIDITETLIRITAASDGEVLSQSGNIVYTHDEPVVGGAYRIDVSVTDVLGNESVAEPVEFTVEGVQPTVSIVSPDAGRIVDPRQPLIISVALTGNGDITVSEFQINGNDVEGTLEDNWLTHTLQPPLVGGESSVVQRGSDNTISVKIVDSEGRTAEGSTSFAVSLDDTAPMISGPAPSGEITRKIGRVTALVTDNESDITRIQYAIDDNPLQDISFSPGRSIEVGGGKEVKGQTSFNFFDAPLGTHTVTIVAESTGGSSTLTWEFTIVSPDSTPPEVVTYSPLGIIRTDRPILAATVSDESGFARDGITLILAGVPGNQGSGRRSSPTSTTVTFTPSISVTPGPYTARLTVIDRYNNRTEAEWQFTVELDETPPSITTTSPHGITHLDKPIISVSASDDMSGVDDIEIAVKDGGGLPVNGVTIVRTDKTAANFTPTQALRDGTHTVDVKVTDMRGNTAASRWQFTVELDQIPPSILLTRPSQEHTENRRPVISAAYTDNLSGVDADSIKLTLDGTTVEPDELSETQVVFTPGYDLPFGPHTVKLEVADLAPKANSTVHEWTFYVERTGIADARNYPNPFDHETMIAFRISRQAKITVRVYDFNGQLVATPVANSVREAGLVEVEWHNETGAGDHLARGVYFCHILMESELEPQTAILKMAILGE